MKKYLLNITMMASVAIVSPSAYGNVDESKENSVENSYNTTIDDISNAIKNGTAYINARYRFEAVDVEGFDKKASASTLRTKLGFKTAVWNNFQFGIEAENISEIGADDYNSTTNGNTTYPTVVDVEGTELNESWVSFTGINDTTVKFGRQTVKLDNQRFVGNVGWRQNDQTYDALAVINSSIPDTTLTYGYVYNVNRIFGNDHIAGDLNTDTHLFNAAYNGLPEIGSVTAYSYLLDVDNAASASSATYGLSVIGQQNINEDTSLSYHAEYALQSDYGNNPISYDTDYYRIQSGINYNNFSAKVGLEVLGSDNGAASFSTPLATLHAHNGWADQFLSTPANGLEDIYGIVSYKIDDVSKYLDGTKLILAYHDFSSDEGSTDYGNEWNFSINQTLHDNYTIGIKYANYDADSFSKDTEKLIFTFGIKFSQ